MTRTNHDALYHRFFSDPQIVAQLLRTFVTGPWLAELDVERMERLNAKFHADTGERRDGDMIWRIPRHDGRDAYLMLLLEFQSTTDIWMALRVLVYAGLLWQHLVKQRLLPPDGRLPPILPVVVYNGDPRWEAPTNLRDLIALSENSALWNWQPDFRYYLIDEGAFADSDLAARDGLPALLFRLETASGPDDVRSIADALVAWLSGKPGFEAARSVFRSLLAPYVAPSGSGLNVPQELEDIRNMLATRMETWARAEQEAARRLGEETGRRLGEETGRRLGEETGRRSGQATLLLRLLEHRFGTISQKVRTRVLDAEIAQIEDWSLRMLDATTINDVLN